MGRPCLYISGRGKPEYHRASIAADSLYYLLCFTRLSFAGVTDFPESGEPTLTPRVGQSINC